MRQSTPGNHSASQTTRAAGLRYFPGAGERPAVKKDLVHSESARTHTICDPAPPAEQPRVAGPRGDPTRGPHTRGPSTCRTCSVSGETDELPGKKRLQCQKRLENEAKRGWRPETKPVPGWGRVRRGGRACLLDGGHDKPFPMNCEREKKRRPEHVEPGLRHTRRGLLTGTTCSPLQSHRVSSQGAAVNYVCRTG